MATKTRSTKDDSRSINKSQTQASSFRKSTQEGGKVKNCYFYKDGDLRFRPVTLVINPRRVLRLESIITELSTKMKGLPFGVRSIFTPRGNDMITSLDGLEHGQSYVCSSRRHQAVGVDPEKVQPPPRWYYDKPSSGLREYNTLLQEFAFEDRARFVGRRYMPRDQRMADAYNRNQPKKVTVFKNGDPTIRHVVLINRRTAQSFEQILADLSSMFSFAVRKLHTVEGRKVRSLTGLINGPDVLVAAGKEPFKTMVGFVYEPESTNASPSRIRSRMGTQDDVANRLRRRRDRMMRTRGSWKIWCTTNELSRAGSSAQVTITVYGHKGNSGPLPLGYPDGVNFQPGRIDEFDINVGPTIGEIYKIRIAHDNTGESPGWFCDEVRMKDVDTDETLTFPCRRWLSRDEDDHDVCREMPAVRRGEPHLPVIKYDVTVVTGDLWNGGTQSNVYLTIYGERGDTGIRQLYVDSKDQAFNKGQVNHFTLEAVSLGHLKKVIIGHDGTVPGDGWYLEKVSIQEPDAKPHEAYHFYCGRWLDEGEDDGKIVRELKVQDEYMEDILEKRNWEYEKWKFENRNQVVLVSMLSGKALRIKTDGSVDGLGEDSDSTSCFIVSSKKPMIRIFTSLLNSNFHLAIDHGKVTGQGRGGPQCEFRIHVQPDRSVMLEGAKSPLQFITLQENGKLGDSRTMMDKDPGKRFHVYVKGVMRHRGVVMLRTSNIQAISADHDKSVYATGRCNRAAHFRVHKVDSGGIRMFESMIYPGFYLRLKDGKFDCNGRLDDEGSRNEDSHFLVQKHKDKGYFTIQLNKQRGMFVGFTPRGDVRPTIDTGINNIHIFPEIIEAGVSKQKMIEDKLTPISERDGFDETPRSYHSPDVKKKVKPEIEEGDFSVLLSSAENLENGQVALLVFGDQGSTGPIMLNGPPDNGPLFRGGSTDEFKINLAKIGNPFKIRLELIPRNQNKYHAWKVERLILADMMTQEKLVFPFNRWMTRSKDDEEIMRELPVVRPGHESEALPVLKYVVIVYTGKDPGSETNAEVYINTFGDYGDTGKRQLRLSNKPKSFQKGQTDQFEIEAVHLGKLSKVLIGHDETKPGEGWFLEKVIIREGKTANMQFVFPCGRWLDSSMEDRKLERVLLVQEPAPSKLSPEPAPSKLSPVRELSSHPLLPPIGSPLSKVSDNTEKFEEEERKIMEADVTEEEEETDDIQETTIEEITEEAEETKVKFEEEEEDDNEEIIAEVEEEDEEEEEKGETEEKTEGTVVEAIEDKEEEMEEAEVEKNTKEEEEELDLDEVDTLPLEESKKEEKEEENTQVHLVTHHDSGAKMEDTVVLYVYGNEGKVGPLVLGSGRDGLFQPGAEDKIKVHIYPDLGRWYKLRIGVTEEVKGADWHLDRLILSDTTYGNQIEFDVDRWMSRERDDFDMWRELPVIRNDGPSLPVIRYTIEVHTGDVPGADSDAAIYINLTGQRGDCGKRRLYKTLTEGKMFSQGKIDTFVLEAVSLGNIETVDIGHEEMTPGKGWYLSYVAVKELNSNDQLVETYFPCDRWFDAGQEDKLTERVLLPGQRPKTKSQSSGEYRMWVTTAEDSEATEGGKATVIVYGDKGKSDEIKLFAPNSTAKLFDAGNSDEFEMATGDIGEIYKIRVTKEDDPTWKTWHLEEVKMEDKVTGETFVFAFDRWFSRDMEDGDLSRELPVITKGKELIPVKCYEIQVTTGDHWAAETDASVSITLVGSQGDTGKRLLHKTKSGRKAFYRGQDDVFTLEAVDLMEIEKVEIEHDGKGPGSGWFLDFVSIKEAGKSDADSLSFPCYRWLDEGEGDGKTSRILRNMSIPHVPLDRRTMLPNDCTGAWKMRVKTSDIEGADTHAQIYLTVQGSQDYSHPVPIGDGSSTEDFFLQGKESIFDIELDDIGQLRKIRLEHDNRNPNPSWHLDWVAMLHVDSGFEYVFPFDCWLSEDKYSQVFRERAVEIPGCMPTPVLHYVILVQTGRAKDSGAHGGLCTVNLIGSQEETGQQLLMHPLSNVNDCMREGITDVYLMEAVSVGEVKRLRLGFEGRGRAKQWFVESVRVMESLQSQVEFVFKANVWLDDNDNSAITLSLKDKAVTFSLPAGVDYTALHHNFPQSKGSWDLWVWTGQQDGAGTSETVNLWLYGSTGHSNPIQINKDQALNSGSLIHTQINSSNLGDIFKIRLAFAEKTGNSSWYLERLKLKDCTSKQEFNFVYRNWIQSSEDNMDGTIELPAIRPDIVPLQGLNYSVTVKTGDLPCAESAAEMTLMLIGQWGDSGQRLFTKSKNNREPFRRDQVDEFDFKLLDLGTVSKILIGHSEHGRGVGWFCQQVTVMSVSPTGVKTETIFDCNRWLDTGVDDRKTLREFSALGNIDSKDIRPGTNSRGPWTCHVEMASEDQLDPSLSPRFFTNQVSLVVYGAEGVKGPVELSEDTSRKFALGTSEKFTKLEFGDIGDLVKIRVSSGLEEEDKTMWTISKVTLEDENTWECFQFDFSNDVGKIGGDVRKERPVLRPGTVIPALIKYKIWVETDDTQGAGTAAKVYATLYGFNGDSGRRILRSQGGIVPFQQGEAQMFEIESVDLGDLEKLVLMKGPGDPWLLNQVAIKAGMFGPVENVFIWSNWIGDNEKRNDEVEVTLPLISMKPSTVAIPADQFPDFPMTRGVWNIETLTGDKGTEGIVDDVTVVFIGTKAESSPIPLKALRESPFQPGMTDTFEVHLAEDVGDLVKMRLGFADNSVHKAWHLKKIKFEDKETQDTFWFAFNEAVRVDDVTDGSTEFPVVWPGVFILPVVEYTITVETGDMEGAGTLAQILIQIEGQMGTTGYRVLKDTRSENPKFQQGQTDTFVIKAVSLLSMYSVTIGHVEQNLGQGWFLKQVKVKPSNEEEDYIFKCNRWLDAGQDDGETMRTLYLSDDETATVGVTDEVPTARTQEEPVTEHEPEPEKGVTYEVTTVTGSGVGHGTNAPAIIVLYGENGHTDGLLIGGGGNGFKEGETQQFKVYNDDEIGELFKVRVGFDGEGKENDWYSDLYQCPSWYPEMVKVRDLKTGKELVFEMRQWVRMEEDHDHWKEFTVLKDNPSQMLVVRDYFVDVHTGSKFGSGTDANVYLQIHGQNGDTGWRHMHGSRTNANKFETGAHDLFRVEAVDLGQLTKVKIKHDGYGPGSGWYLDHVKVKESEDAAECYLFECDKWLDEGEDDQTLERELPLTRIISEAGNEKPQEAKEPKAGDWRVYTTTSSEPGSGTDANVTLTVIGDKGDSGALPLASEEDSCFKDGQTDQFDIWLEPGDIGEIKKVRLEQDGSGSHSPWKVDQLIMENLLMGTKLTFNINRWLSADDQNGDTVYEAAADYPDRPKPEVHKYVVKTVTEQKPEAGTDANVYINIVGINGDSGKRWLRHDLDHKAKFDIGMTNLFLVEAVDLGELEKVIIGHDQSGKGSAWKLQCVMVRKSLADKQTIVFPWGKWIPDLEGGGHEVTILASSELVDETELEEKENIVYPLPEHEVADRGINEELALNLPQSDRTEANNTYRTDEGIQDDYGIDDTYRTDDVPFQLDNIADIETTRDDQTARMYTASDSTALPGTQEPETLRESNLNNESIIEEAPQDNTLTERASDINDENIDVELGSAVVNQEENDQAVTTNNTARRGEADSERLNHTEPADNEGEASPKNEELKDTDRTEEVTSGKDHVEESKTDEDIAQKDNIDDSQAEVDNKENNNEDEPKGKDNSKEKNDEDETKAEETDKEINSEDESKEEDDNEGKNNEDDTKAEDDNKEGNNEDEPKAEDDDKEKNIEVEPKADENKEKNNEDEPKAEDDNKEKNSEDEPKAKDDKGEKDDGAT